VNAFSVDGIVFDIEGTVSSIDFVYRTMFPYVRRELEGFLARHGNDADVATACRLIAQEGGLSQFESLLANPASNSAAIELIRGEVIRLMDADAKATGLKQLQGLIWRSGFESRELVADLFPDVPERLQAWSAAGIKLYIYSSGSVAAQQLFFGHTQNGDLRGLLAGYFDTTTGPKREPASYAAIARATGIAPARLLFVSDVDAELSAATQAGLQCVLAIRAGNPTEPDAARWPQVDDFCHLQVRR
jgi:enolase-phosphatase E1